MESRIQRVFLMAPLLVIVLALTANAAYAQEDGSEESEKTILDAVIEPDLDRRTIDEDLIDTENFELGFFSGVMSVEDFGSNNV